MHNIRVLEYLNYREFLRDAVGWLKEHDQTFSQKGVQFELGISSSGFLSNVLVGRKNLTANQAARMTRILKLNGIDSAYFEALVLFTQARTTDEKNEFFGRLMNMQSAQLKQLPENTLTLFSKWYYVAIREVIDLVKWKDDYGFLAASLQPAIKVGEAKEAVDVLLQLGLIRRNQNGIMKTSDTAISAGDELASKHVLHFQVTTMDLAKQALQDVSAANRDISVLSMGLSEDSFRLVKNEIRHFRKRLAKIAIEDKAASRVYQLNFQFFPLSQELPIGKEAL